MAEQATSGQKPQKSKGFDWLQPILLIFLGVVVVLTFGGVFGHEFVHYDDTQNIINNSHVAGLTSENIHWMLTDTVFAPRYMPLGWFCYALERQLFGLNPQAWHAGNLLFHLLNTFLLFFLLKKLVRLAAKSDDSKRNEFFANCAGALGALFWTVNPLRVETVAWASSRIFEVAFFFATIWLLAWLQTQTTTGRKRIFFSWLSLTAFGASLLTYPLAMFAPVVLLALDIYPLRKAPSTLGGWKTAAGWKLLREKAPFFMISAAIFAITIGARISPDDRFRPVGLAEFGLVERLAQGAYVFCYYAWKPLSPFGLAGSYPTLHAFDPFDAKFVANGLLCIGITIAVFRYYKRWPVLLAIWLCHLCILLPVLGLSEYPHSPFDRYSYLHGILWSAVIALGVFAVRTSKRLSPLLYGSVAGCSFCFAVCARTQVPVWHDNLSLYSNIVSRFGENPGRGRFDEVLGVYYARAGRDSEAEASLENAIRYDWRRKDRRLYDEHVIPRCQRRLGELAASQDDLQVAAYHYQRSVETDPDTSSAAATTLKLSAAYSRLNRAADAIPWLKKALANEAEDPELHHALGKIMQDLGNSTEARQHFEAEQRLRTGRTNEVHAALH